MRYFLRRQSYAVANTKTVLAYARGLQPFFFKVHADDGNLAVKVQICVALPFAQGATQHRKSCLIFVQKQSARSLPTLCWVVCCFLWELAGCFPISV